MEIKNILKQWIVFFSGFLCSWTDEEDSTAFVTIVQNIAILWWNLFTMLQNFGKYAPNLPTPLYFVPNNLQIYLGWWLDPPTYVGTNSQILPFFFKASNNSPTHSLKKTRYNSKFPLASLKRLFFAWKESWKILCMKLLLKNLTSKPNHYWRVIWSSRLVPYGLTVPSGKFCLCFKIPVLGTYMHKHLLMSLKTGTEMGHKSMLKYFST